MTRFPPHFSLRLTVAVLILLGAQISHGQVVPGAKPAGILPPNFPGAPGQFLPGQIPAGPGVQVQIPQVPQVGLPGQFQQNGNSSLGSRRGGNSSNSGFGGGSTPYGSAMAGQAAVLNGAGQYELGTAQGNVLNQQATSMYFDTYKQTVNTYFDMRRIHDSAKAEHEKVPATREQLETAAKIGVPQRLAKDQFETATGKIAWPEVLTTQPFAEFRTKLEQLFSARLASGGGRGTDNYHAIRTVTNQMQSRLQSMAQNLTPQEYVAGHKFIASLAHEGGMIPHPGVAAAK
jgi:hypothetical protein